MSSKFVFSLSLISALTLSGCGGNSAATTSPSSTTPSAAAGPMAFVQGPTCDDTTQILAVLEQNKMKEISAKHYAKDFAAKTGATWVQTSDILSYSLRDAETSTKSSAGQNWGIEVVATYVPGTDLSQAGAVVKCAYSQENTITNPKPGASPSPSPAAASSPTANQGQNLLGFVSVGGKKQSNAQGETGGVNFDISLPAQIALGNESKVSVQSSEASRPSSSVSDSQKSDGLENITSNTRYFASADGSVLAVETGVSTNDSDTKKKSQSVYMNISHELKVFQVQK